MAKGLQRPPTAGGAEAVGVDRRGPADQRGRLRLGQAGQGRARHRLGRRPAGRRAAGRGGARPAPGHHRRGRRGRHRGRPADRRPPRGAARPVPAAAGAVVDGGLALVELSPQATSLTALRRGLPALRPGRAPPTWSAALVDPAAPVPPAVDADALAEARRLVGAGDRGGGRRPAVAGRGRRAWWPRRPRPWPRPCPAPGSCPPCGGATCTGPSTWAWPPGCCPAGSPSTTAGTGSPGLGLGAGGPGPRHRRHPGRGGREPAEGAVSGRWCCSGADPLADFPDRRLADRALDGAEFVVAVATAPGRGHSSTPTWSCPAAEAHERPGTTTNIEGRVSRLGQKLVPPGQAWPDWMIAAELAVHLGGDLGLDSVGDVWDEIERLAPAYRGITRAVLDAPGAGRRRGRPAAGQRRSRLGAGRVGAPRPHRRPRGGVGRAPGGAAAGRSGRVARPPGSAPCRPGRPGRRRGARPARPCCPDPSTRRCPTWRPNDSYSLRLVASRALYDQGAAVGAVPALAGLVARPRCGPTPPISTSSAWPPAARCGCARPPPRPCRPVVPDASLPRKVVAADFNVPSTRAPWPTSSTPRAPVVELRMETP